jgi:DNA-binding transcriptional LysR family regulator
MMSRIQMFSQTKKISCCAIPQFSIFQLNLTIDDFAEQNPSVTIELHNETDVPTALGKLLDREYDFVILRQPIGDYGAVEYTFLAEDQMLAVFPKHNALSSKAAVTVSELAASKDRIILDSCMSSVVTDLMPVIGNIPHIASKELIRRQDMLAKISSGGGVSLYFSDDVSVFRLNNVVAVPLLNMPHQPLVIAASKNNYLSKEHLAFRQHIVRSTGHLGATGGI